MKFGETLNQNLTSEWRNQYIAYERIKEIIEPFEGAADAITQQRKPTRPTSILPARWETGPQGGDGGTRKRVTTLKKGGLASLGVQLLSTQMGEAALHSQFNNVSEEFFEQLNIELEKINLFFAEKIARATRSYMEIESSWASIQNPCETNQKHLIQKTTRDMKFAISEIYLMLKKIEVYRELNFTGFRKLTKKHDKILVRDSGKAYMKKTVEHAAFWLDKNLPRQLKGLEEIMIQLHNGNTKTAMERLRVPPIREVIKEDDHIYAILFALGFQLAAIILLNTVNGLLIAYGQLNVDYMNTILLFRPTFLIWLFLLLFSVNMAGWSYAGVNNVLIFELDPRNRLTFWHMATVASSFGVVWSICLLIYFIFCSTYVVEGQPLVYTIPILMNLTLLAFFAIRTDAFKFNSTRKWLQRVFMREVKAGFLPVCFVDFWLADQFNSLAIVFLDIEFFVCFFVSNTIRLWRDGSYTGVEPLQTSLNYRTGNDVNGTQLAETSQYKCGSYAYGLRYFIAIIPAYIRFAQCIRRYMDSQRFHHLYNAGKYSTAFIKVITVAVHESAQSNTSLAFYMISHGVSSIYTLYWDLINDWGLLRTKSENYLLRDELIYGHGSGNYMYFIAMIEDTILRFAWIAKYFLTTRVYTSPVAKTLIATIFAVLEVVRRFVWNFFRLENEHLNNCGEFRAVRDISIAPLKENDQVIMEKMMDGEMDRINRSKKDFKRLL